MKFAIETRQPVKLQKATCEVRQVRTLYNNKNLVTLKNNERERVIVNYGNIEKLS